LLHSVRGRRVLIAVAAALIGGGAGAAYAATPPATGPKGFLHDVATRLGISDDKLADALRDAAIARVDRALAAGTITKDQADRFKAQIQSGRSQLFLPGPALLPSLPLPVGIPRLPGARFLPGGPIVRARGFVPSAAAYLQLTPAQLLAQLRSGKTLAQLVQDAQKTVAGLKQAIKDAVSKELDARVNPKLTDAQKQAVLNRLDAVLDSIITGKKR
jgi:hypothetical protein